MLGYLSNRNILLGLGFLTYTILLCGCAEPMLSSRARSIKFSKAPAFWSKAPPAQDSLEHAPGCLLAAGLGEAPYLRQATFTMWESPSAMDAYARSGAHLEAIQTAYQGQFFSESMFTRFIPINPQGIWRGKHYD